MSTSRLARAARTRLQSSRSTYSSLSIALDLDVPRYMYGSAIISLCHWPSRHDVSSWFLESALLMLRSFHFASCLLRVCDVHGPQWQVVALLTSQEACCDYPRLPKRMEKLLRRPALSLPALHDMLLCTKFKGNWPMRWSLVYLARKTVCRLYIGETMVSDSMPMHCLHWTQNY